MRRVAAAVLVLLVVLVGAIGLAAQTFHGGLRGRGP